MSVSKVNSDGSLTRIAGGTLYADTPIGSIIYTYETTAPDGFLFPRGQTLSRTEYSDLFNFAVSRGLLETTAGDGKPFGLGDGSTTFTLPNLNGEFLRVTGTNSHANQGNGGTVGQHQDATEMPYMYPQEEAVFTRRDATGEVFNIPKKTDASLIGPSINGIVGGGSSITSPAEYSYTSRPTNTSLNAMMKVKQTALPADFIEAMSSMTVDSVQDGNMHAVTSNAVYDALASIGTVVTDAVEILVGPLAADGKRLSLNLGKGTWIVNGWVSVVIDSYINWWGVQVDNRIVDVVTTTTSPRNIVLNGALPLTLGQPTTVYVSLFGDAQINVSNAGSFIAQAVRVG